MSTHVRKLGVFAAAAVLVALLGPVGSAQERVPQRRVVKPAQPAVPQPATPVPQQPAAPQNAPVPVPVPVNTDPVVTPPATEAPVVVPAIPAQPVPQAATPAVAVPAPFPVPTPVVATDPEPKIAVSETPAGRVRTFTVVTEAPVAPAKMVEPPVDEAQATRRLARYELGYPNPAGPPVFADMSVTDALPPPNPAFPTKDHPAVGAWFGQAIQVCPAGVAPSACNQGTPAYTLFMTPTLLPDGLFVADDTGALGGPPDGPHTAAFGQWYPTSATEFTADYLFMTNPYPVVPGALAGLRARWVAKVIDADTMVGWVNAYLMPKTPITWKPLQYNEFPTIPAEGLKFVTSPAGFVTDPLTCQTPGCPVLVLKFTVKRIKQ